MHRDRTAQLRRATQSYAELCRLHGGMYSALINTSPFFCLKKCHAGLQESRPFGVLFS